MTARHCLAFLTDPTLLPWPTDLEAVEVDGIFALLSPRPTRLRVTRRAMLKDAAVRMARLEGLMNHGTVIPTLADVALTPDHARTALRANHAMLQAAARHLRGKVQFQLCIRWDEAQALTHFQRQPGPLGNAKGSAHLQSMFQEWTDGVLATLGAEVLALPVAADVVVNRALLLPLDSVPSLDAAVEAIDALWSEGLSIRLTGPSPAVSFSSISMRPVQPSNLREALASLDLSPGASLDDLQSARRKALLSGGPAEGARILRHVEVIRLAAAAGWPTGPIPELSLWSEDRAGPEPMRGAA